MSALPGFDDHLDNYGEPGIEDASCGCVACNPGWYGMYICALCGNKRCPHTLDHRFVCTRSNEPGQVGVLDESSPVVTPVERTRCACGHPKDSDAPGVGHDFGSGECYVSGCKCRIFKPVERTQEQAEGLLSHLARLLYEHDTLGFEQDANAWEAVDQSLWEADAKNLLNSASLAQIVAAAKAEQAETDAKIAESLNRPMTRYREAGAAIAAAIRAAVLRGEATR